MYDSYFRKHLIRKDTRDFTKNLKEQLMADGIVTLDKIQDVGEFISIANSLGDIVPHRDSEENGLTKIIDKHSAEKGYLGFSNQRLRLHTDGSGMKNPTPVIMIYCEKPSISGGDSILVDGKKVYEELKATLPDFLKEIETDGSCIFMDGNKPRLSSIFSSVSKGYRRMRFRYDNLGFYSATTIPFMHASMEYLEALSFSIKLKKGQGYIIQNGRYLHGRSAFVGDRVFYRALIDPSEEDNIFRKVMFNGFTV